MAESKIRNVGASPLTWIGVGFWVLAGVLYVLGYIISATVFVVVG